MTIRLEPHIGINILGVEQDNGQWQIFDGDRLVGFLNYLPDSEIQPVYRFPYDRTEEIRQACIAERERHGKPSGVRPPLTTLKEQEELLDRLMEQQGVTCAQSRIS